MSNLTDEKLNEIEAKLRQAYTGTFHLRQEILTEDAPVLASEVRRLRAENERLLKYDEHRIKAENRTRQRLDDIGRAMLRAVTCDHDRPALEMLEEERDELRQKMQQLEASEARAVEAERQRDKLIGVAERFAPCPFVLFPDSTLSLYKEDCKTCSPKKDIRLACLREWASQKDGE